MIKDIHFDEFNGSNWPSPAELASFFLAPAGKEWSYKGGNDSWLISVDGLRGTSKLPPRERINARMFMTGHPNHGVSLQLNTWDGTRGSGRSYLSKGDVTKIRDIVYSQHGTPLLLGTFLPFPTGWLAVKEFMETEGNLPRSIEWLDELPAGVPELIEKAYRG